MQPILYICKEMLQIPGTWFTKMWWEQEVLDLTGARAMAAAAEEEGGPEYPEG